MKKTPKIENSLGSYLGVGRMGLQKILEKLKSGKSIKLKNSQMKKAVVKGLTMSN